LCVQLGMVEVQLARKPEAQPDEGHESRHERVLREQGVPPEVMAPVSVSTPRRDVSRKRSKGLASPHRMGSANHPETIEKKARIISGTVMDFGDS